MARYENNNRRRGGNGGGGGGGYSNRGRNDGRGSGGSSRGGGRGGNQQRGRNGRGGYRRRQDHDPRHMAESGNQRERIAIESGHLVLIDQFMLANPQFVDRLKSIMDADATQKNELIQNYGGTVVELTPGTYRIERDPYAFTIVVHPESNEIDVDSLTEEADETEKKVLVDTRCLAMIDRELLDDTGLLEKYQQLWFTGQEKACRDLLRDNGGAVRYGFQRSGDELGVYTIQSQNVVCLWPENINEANLQSEEA